MFVVFFPVEDAEICGQLLSEPFESEEECRKDARRKWNSSKKSLLNKCEEEFKKQDVYVDWKKEKKEYEAKKESMTEAERNETEEALEMKRIKIKKRRLGNIQFTGQLIRKVLIREKIMHVCIQSLMKLTETLDGGVEQAQDDEMDEEDHEALCQLLYTIERKLSLALSMVKGNRTSTA
jgi:translation initiation factor 4G